MINTDQEWKRSVYEIAVGRSYNKETILEAAGYLWDSNNWKRLFETSQGKFLREVHNKCPDTFLRAMYREQVLKGVE